MMRDQGNPVREIENLWIPMPDGARLAARLWLPDAPAQAPVPAIIEYIPYRKRDGTRERDEAMHRYFAAHGYAAVRIDLRGSGDSDGVLLDEYLDQELADGEAAIAWVAAQPWCSGRIGMIGKSWGGFNALQIASRRPPQLAAVIAVCAADDRYSDDAHYMGGCLLNENLIWGSVLFTLNALAPDPAIVGDRWRSMWRERLEQDQPFPLLWLAHQRRDEYWKHGSVAEDYDAITCPVYAVSGWADGYSNAVPRLLANLKVPCKGLIGPWGHQYPHEGRPGPAIGFLQEARRWWDHWLRDIDTGIMAEPRLRAWMPAGGFNVEVNRDQPGRWITEIRWPGSEIRDLVLHPGTAGLTEKRQDAGRFSIRSPQDTGLASGAWCAFGFEGELPPDQREDDRRSLCFDGMPLTEALEFLGAPRVRLSISVSQPVAFIAVRLNDVAPDGRSTRITYGLLNLTHRHSHEFPEPTAPGKRFGVELQLNDTAYTVRAGHRLRLAVSTAYWPLAWPAPLAAELTLYARGSRIALPVRPIRFDEEPAPFAPPLSAAVSPVTRLHEVQSGRWTSVDPGTGRRVQTTRVELDENGEPALERIEAIKLITGHGVLEEFSIHEQDPLSAHAQITQCVIARRDDWSTRVESRVCFSADAERFRVQAELRVRDGEKSFHERRWNEVVDRDCV